MIYRVSQLPVRVLLILAMCSLLAVAAWSASSNYAMQMDKASSSLLLDIAAAGNRLVAVGERGHILYSTDNGGTWIQAKVPTAAMLTRVFFLSPELGWAVGHDGNVLASYDGGVNWELQRHGVTAQARLNEVRVGEAKDQVASLRAELANTGASDAERLQLALEEAEYRLDEARLTLEEPVFPPPLMDVWFANEQKGWASGAYGTLLHTANGGRQWQDWSHKVGDPDQLHLNGVIGSADGTLFLASEWGTIFRSSTAGETWETIASGYEGSFFGLLVNPTSDSLFAYGLLGTIYRSTDTGRNWIPVQSKVSGSLFGASAARDGRLIFTGSGGTVTQSTDDGENFTALVQAKSLGVYGIAPMTDGRYMLSGEAGSRLLIEDGPDLEARQ